MTIMTGTAPNTAAVQHFLNSCPAVTGWEEVDANSIVFAYDADVEVSHVPESLGIDWGN